MGLSAYQRGTFNLGWELRQGTSIIPVPFMSRRIGPSPDAVPTAFKQLVREL